MASLFAEIKANNFDDPMKLCRALEELLSSGFVRADGCVFFASEIKQIGKTTWSDFQDRTGFECFVNHVHVEDYLNETDKPDQLICVGQGLAFAYRLGKELSDYAPNERFRIIVGSSENDCHVRFHRIRDGEEWLRPDLESYLDEALWIEDIESTA